MSCVHELTIASVNAHRFRFANQLGAQNNPSIYIKYPTASSYKATTNPVPPKAFILKYQPNQALSILEGVTARYGPYHTRMR